jgi:predicted aspartyl protease
MGTFSVTVEIGDPQGTRFETLEALVDAGASDTVVPGPVRERIGVPVQDRWPFALADGREVEYAIGQTPLRLDGASRIVTVVFGDADAPLLLGATSLETFHLAADPVGRRLIPVPGILMRSIVPGKAIAQPKPRR